MAVEVVLGHYIFEPHSRRQIDWDSPLPASHNMRIRSGQYDEEAWIPKAGLPRSALRVGQDRLQTSFIFNPLHDMESIWWIGTYFVANKDVECILKQGVNEMPEDLIESEVVRAKRLKTQSEFAEQLFYTGLKRRDVLTLRAQFEAHTKDLHPAVWPFWESLGDIRLGLLRKYEDAANTGSPITSSVATGVHERFNYYLTSIEAVTLCYKLHVKVLPPPPQEDPANAAQPDDAGSNNTQASTSSHAVKRRRGNDDDAVSALSSVSEAQARGSSTSGVSKKPKYPPTPSVSVQDPTQVTRSTSVSSLADDSDATAGRKSEEDVLPAPCKGKGNARW